MAIELNMDLKTEEIGSADVAGVLTAVDASGNGRLAAKQALAQDQQAHEETMQAAEHRHKETEGAAERRSKLRRNAIVGGAALLAVGSILWGGTSIFKTAINANKDIAVAQASAAAVKAGETQIDVKTDGFSILCGDATGTAGGRATETVVPDLDPATIGGLKALGVDLKVTDGRSTLTIPAEQCTPAAMAAIAEIVAGANSPKA